MIWLLLILYVSPQGELDVKHLNTYGSKQSCMQEGNRISKLNPPQGTKIHCMSTHKTKGMMI